MNTGQDCLGKSSWNDHNSNTVNMLLLGGLMITCISSRPDHFGHLITNSPWVWHLSRALGLFLCCLLASVFVLILFFVLLLKNSKQHFPSVLHCYNKMEDSITFVQEEHLRRSHEQSEGPRPLGLLLCSSCLISSDCALCVLVGILW